MIKSLCEKGVIVDARRSGLHRTLEDYSDYKTLLLGSSGKNVFRPSKCTLCKDGKTDDIYFRCDVCSKLCDINIWSIVYYYCVEEDYDHDMRPEWIIETITKLNDLADNIPDFVVNDVYNFLLYNKDHPCYPKEPITLGNTRLSLSNFMKDFELNFDGKCIKYRGIIFNLFDLSPPGCGGDIGWMFGWHTLFKQDAWRIQFDYPELDVLYTYINIIDMCRCVNDKNEI